MPKNFQDFLSNLQNLLSLKKNQSKEEESQSLSPNLLTSVDVSELSHGGFFSDDKNFRLSILGFQLVIFATLVLFLLTLTLNIFLTKEIIKKQVELNQKIVKVYSLKDTENTLTDVANTLDFYKESRNFTHNLGDKLAIILAPLGDGFVVENLNVSSKKVLISMNAESALSFVKLFDSYLKTSDISSIALTSAYFDSANGRVHTSLEVNFK